MRDLISRLRRDRSGATAIEYALIAATIGVGITAALGGMSHALVGLLANVHHAFPW